MNLPFHAMRVAVLVADHIESDFAITCLASWDGIHGGALRVGTATMRGVRFDPSKDPFSRGDGVR